MPIEFHCPHCNQLLRTPDGTAGKSAKCPKCAEVVAIPDTTAKPPAASAASEPPAAGDTGQRFAGAPTDDVNPYAAPTVASMSAGDEHSAGELTRRRISMDQILSRAWQLFKDNMTPCILFGLIVIGIQMASSVVSMPLSLVQQAMDNEPAVVVIANVLSQAWGQLVQAFVICISIPFGLHLVRGKSEPLSGIFSYTNRLLRVLGYQLLIVLIILGVVLICAIPVGLLALTKNQGVIISGAVVAGVVALIIAAFLSLKFFLGAYLIIDRDSGITEAFSQSNYFMDGNKGTTFLTMFVVGLLSALFVIVTCCIGSIFVVPFGTIVGVVIYISATGQWIGN